MKQILLTFVFLLIFTGCQDKKTQEKMQAEHDAQVAAQARAELLAELSKTEKTASYTKHHAKLEQLGIRMHNDVISIDTNKSKVFLKNFSDRMAEHLQNASDDLQKGIIETKEAGIDINDEHIHIDINKTKNFLQEWSQHIELLVGEMKQVTDALENNTSH